METSFPQVRAKKKDSDEVVVGWYMEHPFKDDPSKPLPVVVQDERPCEIDISTAAVATGKMAKGPDGKEVELFGNMGDKSNGSDSIRAEYWCDVVHFQDPHVLEGWIEWDKAQGMWMFEYGHGAMPLCSLDSDNIEIIPKESKKKWTP